MDRMARSIWLVSLILISHCAFASTTWTPTTRGYMAIHAFQAFPSDMRLGLNKHRAAFRDAAMGPVAGKESDHINDACRLVEELVAELFGRPDFDTVARKLGRLMALTAALNDPYGTARHSQALDYRQYVQSRLKKLVFAFQPLPLEVVRTTDPCAILSELPEQSRRLLPRIQADYRRFGHSSRFDDRSAAFGAASILFADTCHDMSRIATLIWDRARGEASTARILTPATN